MKIGHDVEQTKKRIKFISLCVYPLRHVYYYTAKNHLRYNAFLAGIWKIKYKTK